MQIGSYGAARQVTGSKHLIQLDNGKNILLDCGMFQGEGPGTYRLNEHFGFAPAEVAFVILSHAHIDHSGLLPRLCAEGFRGAIYCTSATMDLCGLMLADSAKIQEEDFERLARKGRLHPGQRPLYTQKDVNRCMQQFKAVNYNEYYPIDEEVEVLFTDAGHIYGSSAINLRIKENGKARKVTFTGDIGRYDTKVLKDPEPFPQCDVLICESTYGNRLHQPRQEAERIIRQAIVDTCILKKGKLLIPAFSIGRTQEFIYQLNQLDLEGKIPPIHVFVDSPLATSATEIIGRHPECFDEETLQLMEKDPDPFGYDSLYFTRSVDESRAINHFRGPCIIIASSGMMEAGRIKHHLRNHLDDERNTVLISSYCEPGSLGDELKRGDKKVEIWGRWVDVKANITSMDGLSGHADREEIMRYLRCQDPAMVSSIYLVHGEYASQLGLKKRMEAEGFSNIHIPAKAEQAVI